MKKIILFLAIAGSMQAKAQCPPQMPYIDGGALFTIDRYIARSVSMFDLAGLRESNPTACSTEIANLIDLRPTFLRRVAGIWDRAQDMQIGSAYHTAAQQVVVDINTAFDNACLARPLIQAGFYEFINENVDELAIPNYVLNDFSASDPDWGGSIYTGGGSFNFNQSRIAQTSRPTVPDIDKIEARMWFYYLATQYIDMDYNALHAGWISEYTTFDPNYIKTGRLFNMIRDYAINHGKFVVLDAHTDEDLYENSSRNLILDFKSAPFRPDAAPGLSYAMTGSPCDGAWYADINMYKLHPEILKSTGGYPPMAVSQSTGYQYDQTPVMFEWDWVFGPPNDYQRNDDGFPYNFDESSWFTLLDDECQAYWFMSAAWDIKNYLSYRGYVQLPGRLAIFGSPSGTGTRNMLNENAILRNGIIDQTWLPNPDLHFSTAFNCKSSAYTATVRVTNPDGSSVYQWHVHSSAQGWLPITYGPERKISNLSANDVLTITCAQSNFFGFAAPPTFPVAVPANPVQTLEKQVEVPGNCITMTSPAGNMMIAGNNNNASLNETVSTKMYSLYNNPNKSNPTTATAKANQVKHQGINFSVFPNPGKDNISIEVLSGGEENASIYLIDVVGAKKMTFYENEKIQQGKQVFTADIKGLIPGMYYVVLKTGNSTKTQKLTVLK